MKIIQTPKNYRTFIRYLCEKIGWNKTQFHRAYIIYKNFDIVRQLFTEASTSKELADALKCGEATVRKKLTQLKRFGIVDSLRRGRSFYYALKLESEIVYKLNLLTLCKSCKGRITPPNGGKIFTNIMNKTYQFCNDKCFKEWLRCQK